MKFGVVGLGWPGQQLASAEELEQLWGRTFRG